MIRRLRLVLAGAVVLLVLALAAGGVAAVQSNRAGENAAAADRAARSALARGVAARSADSADIDTALLLGVASVNMEESPETLSSLISTLAKQPNLIWSTSLAGDEVMALDVHPSGTTAAALDNRHHVRLVDLSTGEVLAERQVGASRIEDDETRVVRFSPDGTSLAVGATTLSEHPVVLLDAGSLHPLASQPRGSGVAGWQVVDVEFSSNSRSLVAVMNRIALRDGFQRPVATWAYVWNLDEPVRPTRVPLPKPDLSTESAAYAALSPNGRVLYTSAPNVRVHDLRTAAVRELSPIQGRLAISPDGSRLAVARFVDHAEIFGETAILDAATGRLQHTLTSEGEDGAAVFSDNGRRILTVTWDDRTANVWDVGTGDQISQTSIGLGAPGAADLDPGGKTVVAAGADNALRSWDVVGRRRYLRRIPIRGMPWSLRDFGSWLATTSSGGGYVAYTMPRLHEPGQPTSTVIVDVARRRAYPDDDVQTALE